MDEHRAGRLDAAEAGYRAVLQEDPRFARAWHLLGVLRHQQGDAPQAIEFIQRAIGLESHWPVFFSNLGAILHGEGRLREAEEALARGLALEPQGAPLLASLAQVLCEQNRCNEAIGLLQRALQIDPQLGTAQVCLGHAYSEIGVVHEAIAAYQAAYATTGEVSYRILAATQLPLVYESAADVLAWRERLVRELDALHADHVKVDLQSRQASPVFSLPHQGFDDLAIQRKLVALYRAPELPPGIWQPAPPGHKIRVGFISSYLCLHTIGKLSRGLITSLSREQFHVTLFSITQHDDVVANELAASVDRQVVLGRDLARARRAILENSVDILFYTDIGMDHATYTLAFSRLAPVQCTTWGHPETTGLATIDYFLSSAEMETAGAEAHYSERLVKLPSLTFCFTQSQLPPNLLSREQFGLHPTAHLYACPQSIYKLHPDFDAALAGILRRDPQGQIVLIEWAYPEADEQLRRRFARTMPDVAGRIVFVPRLQSEKFMNFLTLIDVLLDPFPYGGGNSSLEGFSCGVPVVTLPTEFLRGRITQALCRRLGIEQCIAADLEEYIQIAVRLGSDPDYRRAVRDQILANRPHLFNGDEAKASLEAFLIQAAKMPVNVWSL